MKENDKETEKAIAQADKSICYLGDEEMGVDNQWQYCKKCGRDQRFEFSIRDEIWEKLPIKWQDHVLCIECFLEEFECFNDQKFCLKDFVFLGIVGKNYQGGILIDEVK